MSDPLNEAHDNRGDKTASDLEREALSGCSKFTPINETNKMQQSSSTGENVLLRTASDTDSSYDSETSGGPARYIYIGLKNQRARQEESFEPHETDPYKTKAVFKPKLPDSSGWYTQKDIPPEERQLAKEDNLDEGSFFIPDPSAAKVPQRRANSRYPFVPWTKTSAWRWQRTTKGKVQVWSPSFIFRRFSARTFKYEQIYVGKCHINGVGPNNKHWQRNYNKWIEKIKRRSDSSHVQRKPCERWTVPEIRAMYAGINDFLHTNGIDAYGRATDANLRDILDAINEAGNKNRSMIALRGQMTSSHASKNPSIGYLHKHVPGLVKYIADGGILSDAERFPRNFIPEEEFPTAPGSDRPKGKTVNESVEHAAPSEPAKTEMEADRSAYVEMSDAA